MSNESPLISIITINLNNREGLRKTIDSVLELEFDSFEHVIIDGGSNDGSVELIEEYVKLTESKVSYWESKKDKGIYNAMNNGVSRANGRYCLFLNSGDYLHEPTALKKFNCTISDVDIIYGCILKLIDDQLIPHPPHSKINFSTFVTDTLPHPATLIKKKALIKTRGYDESLKIVSDWKFFLIAIFKNNASFRFVNENITIFDMNGISSNTINWNLIKAERKQTLEQYFFWKYFLWKLQQRISNKILK
jgi:glycosyltransferase involved in cell wall biosynthesis